MFMADDKTWKPFSDGKVTQCEKKTGDPVLQAMHLVSTTGRAETCWPQLWISKGKRIKGP